MKPQSQLASPARSQLADCPNCRTGAAAVFYEVDQIPVHCLQLVESRADAMAHQRRDLKLGFCDCCGFVFNTEFDPSALKYDEDADTYEEAQGCSPTFRKFSRQLAERLVETYNLQGRTAAEIGCGKGGFLVDLVQSGVGHGIGYDPVYQPGRLAAEELAGLEFRREFFTEQTPPLEVDFFCCRHTLEHIPDTLTFLENIRQNIGNRHHIPVFIEVPDVTRIMNDRTFWDIFYEHCSYFSQTSLEAAYRRAGFDVVESWLDYDDQYLMMVGRATPEPHGEWKPSEEEIEQLDAARLEFQQAVAECIESHRARIARYAEQGKKVAVWGSGSKCVGYLSALGAAAAEQVDCVVDISTFRQGYYMPGLPHKILAPAELVHRQPDAVIVMNPIYVSEITADLHKMGLDPEIVPV